MKQVTTKLTDEQIEDIEKRGTTVYKFLQVAVDEKLKKDSQKSTSDNSTGVLLEIVKSLNLRLDEIHISLEKNNGFAKDKLQIIADILKGKSAQ